MNEFDLNQKAWLEDIHDHICKQVESTCTIRAYNVQGDMALFSTCEYLLDLCIRFQAVHVRVKTPDDVRDAFAAENANNHQAYIFEIMEGRLGILEQLQLMLAIEEVARGYIPRYGGLKPVIFAPQRPRVFVICSGIQMFQRPHWIWVA